MKSSVLPLLFGFILLGSSGHLTARHGQDAHGGGAAAAPQQRVSTPRLLRTADEVAAPPQGIEPLPVYVIEPDDARTVVLPT